MIGYRVDNVGVHAGPVHPYLVPTDSNVRLDRVDYMLCQVFCHATCTSYLELRGATEKIRRVCSKGE